jgi:hypothetical protein
MKKAVEVIGWLTAILIFGLAGHSVLAQDAQNSRARRAQSAEVREDVSPVSILREARKIYVRPGKHVDAKYLEYKLQKHREFADWGLMVVEDEEAADLVIKIDKSMLNYIFSVVDPRSSIVVTNGKIIAVNKQLAAEYLGTEIIKKMKNVRASSDPRPAPKKKKANDDEDEEWSES